MAKSSLQRNLAEDADIVNAASNYSDTDGRVADTQNPGRASFGYGGADTPSTPKMKKRDTQASAPVPTWTMVRLRKLNLRLNTRKRNFASTFLQKLVSCKSV
jgi:hypothetical protein